MHARCARGTMSLYTADWGGRNEATYRKGLHMQLGTHQPAGEAFAAAVARRMLSQEGDFTGRPVPESHLLKLRAAAGELARGFDATRVGITQALVEQQVAAGRSIAALWPADADMQLIARETSGKALAGMQAAEDAGDEEEPGMERPRG